MSNTRKKFWYFLAIFLLGINPIITVICKDLAYAERGYTAIGGEALVPIVIWLLAYLCYAVEEEKPKYSKATLRCTWKEDYNEK